MLVKVAKPIADGAAIRRDAGLQNGRPNQRFATRPPVHRLRGVRGSPFTLDIEASWASALVERDAPVDFYAAVALRGA
jgi:hypothetical protein